MNATAPVSRASERWIDVWMTNYWFAFVNTRAIKWSHVVGDTK